MRGCTLYRFRFLLLAFLVLGLSGAKGLCSEKALASATERAERDSLTYIPDVDFDGDHKPDLAIGRSHGFGYTIEIQFTAQLTRTCLTLANGGIGTRIFAYDVDKDSYQDLVVTDATSLLPIAVYLGDGKGHFQEGKPWAFLPFRLDSPYRYEPGKIPTSLVSLLPQIRFSFDGTSGRAMATVLEAGDWVRGESEIQPAQLHKGSSKPRSPPLSFLL